MATNGMKRTASIHASVLCEVRRDPASCVTITNDAMAARTVVTCERR